MPEEKGVLGLVRFGRFELSADTGELRKDGVRLKLSGQAVDVLLLLAANPGKLVTREELQQKLWPGASYGDPEHGLNAAVNRLRETLGDSATEPKYIETVPGRGYRFVASLDKPNVGPTSQPPKPPWWKRKATIAIAACTLVAGLLYPWIVPQIERLWRLNELQRLTVVPLTALPGTVLSPTFSPDGSQVAFAWDGAAIGKGYDLYVKVVGSDKPLRLTSHPGWRMSVAWSPDGRSIAISRSAGEDDSGVYLIQPTGGPERKLAARRPLSWFGNEISWSPDGKRLAFTDHPANAASDFTLLLYLLPLDTLERSPVETGCNSVSTPAFSPRGNYLAWVCNDSAYSAPLWLLRLRDGTQTRLLTQVDGILGIAWSSDERRIVYSSASSQGALWEASLGQPGHTERLPIGQAVSDIAANPAGSGLAYVQGFSNVNIWRLDLLTSPPQSRKLVMSSREQTAPSISPDGSRIAFESTRSGAKEVWVCDADGSNAQQLSHFSHSMTGTPRWSPDGKFIAFDSRVSGEAEIYVVDPQRGVPNRLNIDIHGNSMPAWSRDGAWIYFANGDDAHHPTVWKVPSRGGRAVEIARGTATFPFGSADGHYVYFVRNEKLWQVKTDGSTEELVAGMPDLVGLGDEWFPFASVIYFLSDGGDNGAIKVFDLQTKHVRTIFTLERPTPPWVGGIPVSNDGKWMLYPQLDQVSSDLMMVENWR